MKATIVLFTVLVVGATHAEWDWSKINTFEPSRFSLTPRIVGGEEAVPHSYPHQVALLIERTDGTFLCGGSVVSRKFVLTAAHCVDEKRSNSCLAPKIRRRKTVLWKAVNCRWGAYSDKVPLTSDVLRHVETEVITNGLCNIPYLGAIKTTHICTSGSKGKSTCGGDSGGPLLVDQKQVGIVSFGIILGCEVGWPAVFTRVTEYLDWIAANTDVIIN